MSRTWKDGPEGLGGKDRRRRLEQARSIKAPTVAKVIQLPRRARLPLVVGSSREAAAWLPRGDVA
ncbi:MAG: hypothetical protein ACREN8_10220 [Candidatus Dormibacteraceae bacterium]